MGAAAFAPDAAFHRVALTARHFHWLVDRGDDVVDDDIAGRMGQPVAAAGAPSAQHQTRLAQLDKELFEIFLADVLALGDLGQRNGPALAILADIDHGHHSISTLG